MLSKVSGWLCRNARLIDPAVTASKDSECGGRGGVDLRSRRVVCRRGERLRVLRRPGVVAGGRSQRSCPSMLDGF